MASLSILTALVRFDLAPWMPNGFKGGLQMALEGIADSVEYKNCVQSDDSGKCVVMDC